MKTTKVPRKLKKAFKKAVQAKFPLGNWKSKQIGLCEITTESRFVDRKSAIVVGGKALSAHRLN